MPERVGAGGRKVQGIDHRGGGSGASGGAVRGRLHEVLMEQVHVDTSRRPGRFGVREAGAGMKCNAASDVDIGGLLRTLPSLATITGPEWQRALAAATLVQAPDGSEMAINPNRLDHFTLVLQGALKVRIQSEDGRIFSLLRTRAGEVCPVSLACMRTNQVLISSVLADGEVIALRIPGAHLDRLMSQSAEFRGFIMTTLADCFRKLRDALEETAFGHLGKRIEGQLRERCRESGSRVLRVTHQDLAHDLGSTREVISRLLKHMEHDGRIRLGRGSITLLGAFAS